MKWMRLVDVAVGGAAAGATGAVALMWKSSVSDLGDYLGFIGAAVGAIITVAAAARVQRVSDKRRATAEQVESIAEVRRAVEEALAVHDRARAVFEIDAWKNADAARIAAEADLIRLALNRLLDRPRLTDGAIYSGSGAIRLLEGVSTAAAVFQEPDGMNFSARALAKLQHVDGVVGATNSRLAEVILWQCRAN